MSLRRPAAVRPSPERVQREFELHRALEAARHLQARLELLGDHADDVRSVRGIRDDLAGGLALLDVVPDGLPCQAFSAPTTTAPRPLDEAEQAALTRQALLLEDEVAGDA